MSFLGAPYARDVSVEDWRRRSVTETQDGSLVQSIGAAQRWDIRLGLQTDTFGRNELLAKVAAHQRDNQFNKSFSLLMPQPLGQTGPGSVTVALGAASAVGDATLTIRRTSTGARWTIPVGRFFTVGDDPKIYSTLAALALTNPNEDYELSVYPTLRTAQALAATLNFTPNATVQWHPDGLDLTPRYTDGVVFTYDAAFAESV